MTAARQLSIFDVPVPFAPDSTVPLQSVAPAPTPSEPPSGRQLKREGIDRVESVSKAWVDRAYAVLMGLCVTAHEVTADDLRLALGDDQPERPLAMGAVFRRAAREGVIQETDRNRKSTRAGSHLRPVAVWRVS